MNPDELEQLSRLVRRQDRVAKADCMKLLDEVLRLQAEVERLTNQRREAVEMAQRAKEAPDTGKAVRELAQSGAGIAAAGRRVADEFTKPQTTWQKLKTWVWAFAGLAGRLK